MTIIEPMPGNNAGQPKERRMKTCYFKGDLAKYTGRSVVLHGGLFYEIELIEGHRKGDRVVTQRAPV